MRWRKEDFLRVLGQAHRAERAWVESARESGAGVAHGRKLVLPNHDPSTDHCPTPDAVAAVQLEVKVRSLTFTSPSDYPYPTVYVDDKYGLDAGPDPFAWVYISKPTGEWVWLSSLDRDGNWKFRDVYDTMRGFVCPTLVAPARCLRHKDQLLKLFCRQDMLRWVEGDCSAFGGGAGGAQADDPQAPGTTGVPADGDGEHLGRGPRG